VTPLEPRNAAPTGKTLEVVKERFRLYAFYFYSQQKTAVCNWLIFSRVHAVHREVTGIGAALDSLGAKAASGMVFRGCESRTMRLSSNGDLFTMCENHAQPLLGKENISASNFNARLG
jgi:hypothetical protein